MPCRSEGWVQLLRDGEFGEGMKRYWVSCTHFTVLVELDRDDTICRTAPITKRFVGQLFGNLLFWCQRMAPLWVVEMR
jgi:hypothetical protein